MKFTTPHLKTLSSFDTYSATLYMLRVQNARMLVFNDPVDKDVVLIRKEQSLTAAINIRPNGPFDMSEV